MSTPRWFEGADDRAHLVYEIQLVNGFSVRARVDRRPPVVIGAPLIGTGWAALGSRCDGPHRRALQPVNGRLSLGQRFAIDFNRLDTQNRLVVGNPDVNESYPSYDQPVLAVADATVVEVEDRFRDQIPSKALPVTLEEASGNHVVLRLGEGRFAECAHLKPGSISVRAGQRVREGQVMALTGNSGSSSGPHLHFQLISRPSATDAGGLPYVFRSFVLRGRVPPLSDSLFASASRGEPLPVAGGPPGRTATSCRWGRDVVTLP